MYVHCHKCNWSQDDFWDKYYNPVRWIFLNIKNGFKILTLPQLLKNTLTQDIPWFFKRLWKQHWWTYHAYQMSDKKCPKCKSKLCID